MPNPLQASAVALGQKAAAAAERRAQAKEVLAHKKSLQKDMRKILAISNKIIFVAPPMVEKLERLLLQGEGLEVSGCGDSETHSHQQGVHLGGGDLRG